MNKILFSLVASFILLLSGCGSSTPAASERILFVYDISNSARDWVQTQVSATNAWFKNSETSDAQVSAIVIDAFGGTDNCQRPVDEPVNGEPGNNDLVRKMERDKKVSQVSQRVNDWLNCELESNQNSGSDLALAEFQGYDRVVIFSDGLLRVKSDDMDVYSLITSNSDVTTSAESVGGNYLEQGVDLRSTKIELWGLGYRKNLSAIEAERLKSFWRTLLVNLNVVDDDIFINTNLP